MKLLAAFALFCAVATLGYIATPVYATGPTCTPACTPPLVCKSIVPPVGVPPKPGKGICLPP